MGIYESLIKKEKAIGVIGLGYVGLPITLLFAKKLRVIGYDVNPKRVQLLNQHIDPSHEIPSSEFEGCDVTFTSDFEDLRQAHFFVVTVPTPIDKHKMPDLTPVRSASEVLAKVLKPGDYVVYESTVYPGCTEEVCIPILETSGLKVGKDFKVGYSPERINPGDPVHRLDNTTKIVSGCDDEALENITKVYQFIIKAPLHQAPSIKVAEAAKVIENTQRDLNIALMNELSIIFHLMGINTYDVIEAAATKWNFHRYSPGLVGGHCIGVDPYYLTYKANELGYHSKVILAGRQINDNMGFYVGQQIVKQMIKLGKAVRDSKVLIYGITFKENVADIRNSKVYDLITELQSFMVQVDVVDCHADPDEVKTEYQLKLLEKPEPPYDAIVLAVPHKEYTTFTEDELIKLANMPSLFVDIKGIYKGKIRKMHYWSL